MIRWRSWAKKLRPVPAPWAPWVPWAMKYGSVEEAERDTGAATGLVLVPSSRGWAPANFQ